MNFFQLPHKNKYGYYTIYIRYGTYDTRRIQYTVYTVFYALCSLSPADCSVPRRVQNRFKKKCTRAGTTLLNSFFISPHPMTAQ